MRALTLIVALGAAAAVAASDNPAASPSPTPTASPSAASARRAAPTGHGARKSRPSGKASPAPAPSPTPSAAASESAADAKKAGHVYSNEDLPKDSVPPTVASPGLTGSGRGSVTVLGPGAAPPAAEEPSEPAPPEATEGYWRQRADVARGAIESGEQRVAELQSRISELRSDRGATNVMDPNRELTRQSQITQAEAELERANADLARAREALSNLEEEARRKSIPPGWLRPR